MKHSRLEEFANRHFWSLIVGIFIVFCFFSYGIGHVGATRGQVYTIDTGFYDAEQMKQPKNINGQNLWNNGTYSDTRINKNNVKFSIKDKISIEADLTINPISGDWLYYPANITGNVISYSNTRGIIKYSDYDTILKEEIVLFEPVDSISWILNLSVKPQSLGFQVNADGYSINDPTNADQRIKIPFPYVVDASGVKRTLSFSWNNGQRRLSLVQDFAGLQYPLTIDPTWVVDLTNIVGMSPTMLFNSTTAQIVSIDDTNNKARLFVNNSGSFSSRAIIGIYEATNLVFGATIDRKTSDLPAIFGPGLGTSDYNISWAVSGKWYACQTMISPTVYARNRPTIGVSSSTGRTFLAFHNASATGDFNLTRIEDITGTAVAWVYHYIVYKLPATTFSQTSEMNSSNTLNILWMSGGRLNWTTVTDSSTPTITTILVETGQLINTSQADYLDSYIDPTTDFPVICYVPANTGATTIGRGINYSYYNPSTGRWYHELAYENSSAGMSSITVCAVAVNSTGYTKMAFVERASGSATVTSNYQINLIERTAVNTWSSPVMLMGGAEKTAFGPSMLFDPIDNLHLTWFNSTASDLAYYFEPLPSAPEAGAPPTANFNMNTTAPYEIDDWYNATDASDCYLCTENFFNITQITPPTGYHMNTTTKDVMKFWPSWGLYSIIKEARNASGMDDASTTITIYNKTPTAIFSCAPLSGTRPLTTTCTDGSSGNYTHYNWSAGDGTNISALANPSFTYTVAGSYSVNETIWGDDLVYSIELKNNYITVTDPAPPTTPVPGVGNCTGSIALNISNGYPPLWVNLSYIGNSTVIDNITWMFGEGNTSTDWNPTAVYNWSAIFEASAYACNTTFNECCTATAKIWAWFFTCLQTSEDGNIPVALMYLLVPLTMGLSLFAVGSYDNRVYANIILGGFGSSIMWFYLASNIITANIFYLASDPGCVMMDTPLFWLFVLFGIIMTVYSLALVVEAIMERNAQDLGGEQE